MGFCIIYIMSCSDPCMVRRVAAKASCDTSFMPVFACVHVYVCGSVFVCLTVCASESRLCVCDVCVCVGVSAFFRESGTALLLQTL